MMISPQEYYNEYLKDKDVKEILSRIRGLKNNIGKLKNIIEHPDYKSSSCPSEIVYIKCYREYMKYAIKELEERGYVYQLSKVQLRAKEFQDKLIYLSKVTFEMNAFFNGRKKYIIEFNDDKAKIVYLVFNQVVKEEIIDKEEIIELLSYLYIGEWRRHYDPKRFGYSFLDGTSWSILFEYDNGYKDMRISGCNDYPYNFNEFLDIFGLDE